MWCCGSPIITFNGVPLPLNLGVSISFGPRSVEEGKCPATSVWTTKRGMLSASPTGALTWGAWSWQVKSDDPEVATWIGSPTTQETSGCAQLSSLHLGGIAAQAPDVWAIKPLGDFQPRFTMRLPVWDPRCHGAGTSHSHWALCDLQTYTTREHNQTSGH